MKMTVDVEQSETALMQIPAPGLVSFKNPGAGFGSIYHMVDGKLELVYSFTPETVTKSLELQPGDYTYIFRGARRDRSFYTVEKDFTIKSEKSIIVQL